ncbi:MAG: hypothetical protein EAZ92_04810 [Candidatus Kapaibacterium sp.]|nr:MAG: hypothetical protein EAZ92_04810 [Candidatus Kapabacteria bacterium]
MYTRIQQRINTSLAVILFCSFFLASCKKDEQNGAAQNTTPQNTFSQQNPQSGTTATIQNNSMGKYEQKNSQEQVAFSVDAEKVGAFVNDAALGVSFAPPRNYVPLAPNSLAASDIAMKFAAYTSPQFSIQPVHAFRARNSMLVSSIRLKNISYEQFLKDYENLVRTRFSPANITTTFFLKGDINIAQFFIQEADKGLIRVVFAGLKPNEAVQFDFAIERQTASDDMQAIEPALGSITRLAR